MGEDKKTDLSGLTDEQLDEVSGGSWRAAGFSDNKCPKCGSVKDPLQLGENSWACQDCGFAKTKYVGTSRLTPPRL